MIYKETFDNQKDKLKELMTQKNKQVDKDKRKKNVKEKQGD